METSNCQNVKQTRHNLEATSHKDSKMMATKNSPSAKRTLSVLPAIPSSSSPPVTYPTSEVASRKTRGAMIESFSASSIEIRGFGTSCCVESGHA